MIGRELEYQFLQQRELKSGAHMSVVYGAKGVGKMTLVQEFIRGKKVFYYSCRDCVDREQRFQLNRERTRGISLSASKFPTWTEILNDISKEYSIVVLDEFQYLLKLDGTFLEELSAYAATFSKEKKLYLICMSSSVNWVENAMARELRKKGAAYLLSGMLKVNPLDYWQIADAFPGFGAKDRVLLYSILGGIPGRWKALDPALSMQENLTRCFLDKQAPLALAAISQLRDDLRELNVYQTILTTIACGAYKLNDIYLQTEFSRAKISVYLKNLMQMQVIEKVFSVDTRGREQVQKGIYRISDPLIRFVYTFLFPNESMLRLMDADTFYQQYIGPYLNAYAGETFALICRDYLAKQMKLGKLSLSNGEVGEWVGKNASLHVLIQDEEENAIGGFCNFDKATVDKNDVEWVLYAAKEAKVFLQELWLFSAGSIEKECREVEFDGEIHFVTLPELSLLD